MFEKLFDIDSMKIDPEIKPLVIALNSTDLLNTCNSCEGHFSLEGTAFCHHNLKAQISFYPNNIPRCTELCNRILEEVMVPEINVHIHQQVVSGEDSREIQWTLEYHPHNYWEIKLQHNNLLIRINNGWSIEKARKLLRRAFDLTIDICNEIKLKADGGG